MVFETYTVKTVVDGHCLYDLVEAALLRTDQVPSSGFDFEIVDGHVKDDSVYITVEVSPHE
jgi:hypothetical protein